MSSRYYGFSNTGTFHGTPSMIIIMLLYFSIVVSAMEERAKQRAERKAILDEKRKRQDEEKLVRLFVSNVSIIWFYRNLCTIHIFGVFAICRKTWKIKSSVTSVGKVVMVISFIFLISKPSPQTPAVFSCCKYSEKS